MRVRRSSFASGLLAAVVRGKRQSNQSIVTQENAMTTASGAKLYLVDAVIFGLGRTTYSGWECCCESC
jgi:hypothetical protein